jgi:acyl carrier protein
MSEFNTKLADILGVESVTESDLLEDFEEWDSLSILSVIAMLDSDYGVNLTSANLRDAKTVAELWQIVQANKQS